MYVHRVAAAAATQERRRGGLGILECSLCALWRRRLVSRNPQVSTKICFDFKCQELRHAFAQPADRSRSCRRRLGRIAPFLPSALVCRVKWK